MCDLLRLFSYIKEKVDLMLIVSSFTYFRINKVLIFGSLLNSTD